MAKIDYETSKIRIMAAADAYNERFVCKNTGKKEYKNMVRNNHMNTVWRIFDLTTSFGKVVKNNLGIYTSEEGLAGMLRVNVQTIAGNDKTDGHLSRLKEASLIDFMPTISKEFPTYKGGIFVWIRQDLFVFTD